MRGPRAIPGLCGQFRVQLPPSLRPRKRSHGRRRRQGEEEEAGWLPHARIAHTGSGWRRFRSIFAPQQCGMSKIGRIGSKIKILGRAIGQRSHLTGTLLQGGLYGHGGGFADIKLGYSAYQSNGAATVTAHQLAEHNIYVQQNLFYNHTGPPLNLSLHRLCSVLTLHGASAPCPSNRPYKCVVEANLK